MSINDPQAHALDWNKLTTLVHYICASCEDPSILGGTKLNKVLWYADVNAFIEFGHPITGETYIKQQFGPVAEHLLPVVKELERKEAIVVRQAPHFAYTKWEYISLKSPDISMFKPDEISLVDNMINIVCHGNTAKSISAQTHDVIWELAEIGEKIPYYAVLASELGEFTKQDMEWAKRAISTA
jgi:hypothetical protein